MSKLIFLFFVLISLSGYSQKGMAYYGQITSPGMKSKAGPDLNAYLVFNGKKSYYVTAKDSLEKADSNQKSVYKGDNDQRVAYNGSKTFRYGEQVFFNREKDSLWWNKMFGGMIYIAEKRPEINWDLKQDTKKIGKFEAHKATAEFRGRKYTAWYTPEIPLPYGPWKLQGLPGLILAAHDEYNEMFIYFKSIEYPTDNDTKISQVQAPEDEPKNWMSIGDYENALRSSLKRAYNKMMLRSERKGKDKPDKPVFRETYIESFD